MTALSLRLEAVADLVLPGQAAADVGADHGGLACALVRTGRVPSVIAIEVASGPLGRLQAGVSAAGLSQAVDVRHGDGLAPIQPGEVQTVAICGMGGQSIARILRNDLHRLPGVLRLVLSPHTVPHQSWRVLVEMGWCDVAARWVEDRGHHYPVMAWERGESRWTDLDYRWGRLARQQAGSGLLAYLRAEQQRLSEAVSRLSLIHISEPTRPY